MKIVLKNINGETIDSQEVYNFPFTVGRSTACDIAIENSRVSSKHLEVDFRDGEIFLRDLGSSNGTFLGDERIMEHQAKNNCELNLGGELVLEFLFQEGSSDGDVVPVAPQLALVKNPLTQAQAKENVRAQISRAHSANLGWSYYWHILEDFSGRKFFFLMFFAGLFFMCAHLYVFQAPLAFSAGFAFGVTAVSACAGLFVALCIAVLGSLFRGAFHFKALFYVQTSVVYVLCLDSLVLQPATLAGFSGYLAIALSVLLGVVLAFVASYIQMFNIFPHRWDRKLAIVALFFGLVGAGSSVKNSFVRDRSELLKYMVMKNFTSSRSLAGKAVSVSDLASEIREFAGK